MEWVRHIFGGCGEPHINIWTVLGILSTIPAPYVVFKSLVNKVRKKEIDD